MRQILRPIPDVIADLELRIAEINNYLDARAGRSWWRRLWTWPAAFLCRQERERLQLKIAALRRRYRGRVLPKGVRGG